MADTKGNAGPQSAGKTTMVRALLAEREEMLGFHPEILPEAGELPRKVRGRGLPGPRRSQHDPAGLSGKRHAQNADRG